MARLICSPHVNPNKFETNGQFDHLPCSLSGSSPPYFEEQRIEYTTDSGKSSAYTTTHTSSDYIVLHPWTECGQQGDAIPCGNPNQGWACDLDGSQQRDYGDEEMCVLKCLSRPPCPICDNPGTSGCTSAPYDSNLDYKT